MDKFELRNLVADVFRYAKLDVVRSFSDTWGFCSRHYIAGGVVPLVFSLGYLSLAGNVRDGLATIGWIAVGVLALNLLLLTPFRLWRDRGREVAQLGFQLEGLSDNYTPPPEKQRAETADWLGEALNHGRKLCGECVETKGSKESEDRIYGWQLTVKNGIECRLGRAAAELFFEPINGNIQPIQNIPKDRLWLFAIVNVSCERISQLIRDLGPTIRRF